MKKIFCEGGKMNKTKRLNTWKEEVAILSPSEVEVLSNVSADNDFHWKVDLTYIMPNFYFGSLARRNKQ